MEENKNQSTGFFVIIFIKKNNVIGKKNRKYILLY